MADGSVLPFLPWNSDARVLTRCSEANRTAGSVRCSITLLIAASSTESMSYNASFLLNEPLSVGPHKVDCHQRLQCFRFCPGHMIRVFWRDVPKLIEMRVLLGGGAGAEL